MTAAEKLDWAIATCRAAGFRRTRSLKLVLRRLAERDLPIPVADLVADPDLKSSHDKATVYRILSRLDELGLVRRVGLHERSAAYALHVPNQHHDYLICTECGGMSGLPGDCPVGLLSGKLSKTIGFNVTRHELILWGTCAKCTAPG